jgi:hypothetical protein
VSRLFAVGLVAFEIVHRRADGFAGFFCPDRRRAPCVRPFEGPETEP